MPSRRKFSTPLVKELVASGKTPAALARELETALADYVRDPLVTVTVGGFAVALFIGIITSVFTALFVTRLIIQIWLNWRKPKTLIV